ncbi:MAG: pyridoxamine 5'-phosphate oxidase family protein [Pseudomonadota bacterium]
MSDADRLSEIETDTWNLLGRAVVDKRSPLRWFTLATVSTDGQPEARTVVLREIDRDARRISLFTDRRAAKVAALRANSKAECHFFDSRKMLQFRLSGVAEILTRGVRWQGLFDNVPDYALGDYSALIAPGTSGKMDSDSALAADHFTVIDISIESLDWLSLSREGHQRARFSWQNGERRAEFVVP